MNALTSPLARCIGLSALTAAEWRELERRLWEQHRRIIVGPADGDLKPDQAAVIEAIGEQRFGEHGMPRQGARLHERKG